MVIAVVLFILVVIFLSWHTSASSGSNRGPMRPYVAVDGQLREVVHRRRQGAVVVCTIKPLKAGERRPRIVVPADGDSIRWLPKR